MSARTTNYGMKQLRVKTIGGSWVKILKLAYFSSELYGESNAFNRIQNLWRHGLLIEYSPICNIVKLPISMIRPFSLVNNSHITLYPQLEFIWKVLKSLRKYWGKYGQISFYIISCITRDCIIAENIFLV